MKLFPAILVFAGAAFLHAAPVSDPRIPEALRPWQAWATWPDRDLGSPLPFNDPNRPIPFWPSTLDLDVNAKGGAFSLSVTAFREGWVPLPGGGNTWPVNVRRDGKPIPVLDREGVPHVRVPAGLHRIEGGFSWSEMPQNLSLPRELGLLALKSEGADVSIPAWGADGLLWLRRTATAEPAARDHLGTRLYALIEDGIPVWLRVRIELTVSGKSREEEIGGVLPEGWKIAAVRAPIPAAVDESGHLKAQVRAGQWIVEVDAFRLDNPRTLRFPTAPPPAVSDALVAFLARPDFRMVDITGATRVDVSQTTFPAPWRSFPVYQWDTAVPLEMVEHHRGAGLERPPGLTIRRSLWLDEDGRGLTFRDGITGQMQQIWRLDTAEGQDLGAVRSGGQGMLITRNPQSGASGVEIRSRNLALEAMGRVENPLCFAASGWRADADALTARLDLPPGWRLFALWGADWVNGDWLTAWSLLDLFLLLLFVLAVFRMGGLGAATIAFLAFALSYHEPFAPRYVWLVLLMPLALLRVLKDGWGRRLVLAWKWVMVVALVFALAPFLSAQIQQALFPQLSGSPLWGHVTGAATREHVSSDPVAAAQSESSTFGMEEKKDRKPATVAEPAPERMGKIKAFSTGWGKGSAGGGMTEAQFAAAQNLHYDPQARIQTGPALPEWSGQQVSFGWNGPVRATQEVRAIFIPRGPGQALSLLRVLLVALLAAALLRRSPRGRTPGAPPAFPGAAILAASALALTMNTARASDFPDAQMLETLRNRMMEKSDAFPDAAAIPLATLRISGNALEVTAKIHAGTEVAVPLPGRLPSWSPVSVNVDGKPSSGLRRDDGFLWVVLPEGVHTVKISGLLPESSDWEWAFLLRPHRVEIDAPGWTVNGVSPEGIPGQQVFLSREQKAASANPVYEQQELQSVVQVRRSLELGLVWRVRTTVQRISPRGRAIFLRVPLLPDENVLSANMVVADGRVEVRLAAQDSEFSWESELPVTNGLPLTTCPTDAWVEAWTLVLSPVWNVAISGLAPVFETNSAQLIPVWHPWPGEGTTLTITRPEFIPGPTVTVSRVTQTTRLGSRQKTTRLEVALQCTLGEDFPIRIPENVEVTALTQGGVSIPVRRSQGAVVVPIQPGSQTIALEWKTDKTLGLRASGDTVALPSPAANISSEIQVPSGRWVLWTAGPIQGPAVRFWIVLACALLAAVILGRLPSSPLKPLEWALLALGLTQVTLPSSLLVVGWLFLLVWRGRPSCSALPAWRFNLLQILLVITTAIVLGVFVRVVAAGLLGNPQMFILGNGSTPDALRWFQAGPTDALPQTDCFSVSIWWYRLLMLLWALWLAASLLRWLRWGWQQFSAGQCFRRH